MVLLTTVSHLFLASLVERRLSPTPPATKDQLRLAVEGNAEIPALFG